MRILLATDGSDGSMAAVRLVAALPLTAATRITVVSVSEKSVTGPAWQCLTEACEALRGVPGLVTTDQRHGHPAVGILEAIEQHEPDLAVLGSHGRSAVARLLLGSTSEKVARHSPCPVLLARHRQGRESPKIARILVGLDESDSANAALQWLAAFPTASSASIRLIAALPDPVGLSAVPELTMVPSLVSEMQAQDAAAAERARTLLVSASELLATAGRQVDAQVVSGHPALCLIEQAESWLADLIVVGSHGMGPIDRFLLGSVSEHVLRHAPCSVLVVRRRAAKVDAEAPLAARSTNPEFEYSLP
jgi:nucleotide-binding universal stress UspA family protein